jgi:hypothetical protein
VNDPVDWPTVTRWHLAVAAAEALDALTDHLNPLFTEDDWDAQWAADLERAADTVHTILADTRRRLEGTP